MLQQTLELKKKPIGIFKEFLVPQTTDGLSLRLVFSQTLNYF